MKLPTLNEKEYSVKVQSAKLLEEVAELIDAIDSNGSLRHTLSEAWDVIQATKTLMYVLCKGRLNMIRESNAEHCEKLQQRAEKETIGLRGEWIISTTEVTNDDKG